MAKKNVLRAAALVSVLLAGSCAAPTYDGKVLVADPIANHPITVEKGSSAVALAYAPGAGLMPDDSTIFDVFVHDYLDSGEGPISVTVPAGPASQETIHYIGERLADAGISRTKILVGTRPGMGDGRVELRFGTLVAHTDPCGDWTTDAGLTTYNTPMPNFGCAYQQNIAAQVADPSDLVTPRDMGQSDPVRRNVVTGHYEKGEVTQATKKTVDKETEQSGTSSDADH